MTQMSENPVANTAPNAEPVEMLLNMGPQHPSTHGVFRMVLWVDGEKIVDLEPHIGYWHLQDMVLVTSDGPRLLSAKLNTDEMMVAD